MATKIHYTPNHERPTKATIDPRATHKMDFFSIIGLVGRSWSIVTFVGRSWVYNGLFLAIVKNRECQQCLPLDTAACYKHMH